MRNLTLLTDLYQLTMGYGFYRQNKHEEEVVFDLFFRKNALITYSLFAGLEQAMDYLLNWHFSDADVDYLRSLNLFSEDFIEYIRNMDENNDATAVVVTLQLSRRGTHAEFISELSTIDGIKNIEEIL